MDERGWTVAAVTDAERLLIDQVWTDIQWRNRWKSRRWRLFNRMRMLIVARDWFRFVR